MNWVEKKVRRESVLKEGAPELWNKAKTALENACLSYNQHYVTEGGRKVGWLSEDSKVTITKDVRLQVSSTIRRDEAISVVVSFETGPPAIKVGGVGPVKSTAFPILSDEETAFIGMEREFDIEEVSKRILEPLFFPTGQYSEIS
jgi:hypothetical protein